MRSFTRLLAIGCLLSSAACQSCTTPGGGDNPDAAGGEGTSSSSEGDSTSSATSGMPQGSSQGGGSSGGATDMDGGTGEDGGTAQTLEVTDVVPNASTCTGRERVSIRGNGFRAVSQAFIGDVLTLNQLPSGGTRIGVTLPPMAPGIYDVKVINPDADGGIREEATLPGGFTCYAAVTITSVTPAAVATVGGTLVTLQGTGFKEGQLVVIGGRQATGVVVAADGSSLTAITPPGTAGRRDIEVVSEFGSSSLPLGIRYVAPLRAVSVAPAFGPPGGGNIVSIFGEGFLEETEVRFGANTARVVDFVGEDELRVAVPAGTPGPVDVTVHEPFLGQTATIPAGYLYAGAPTQDGIVALSPATGPTTGGTLVRIYGRGFGTAADAVQVTFDGNLGSLATVKSDTLIEVKTPAGMAGAVDVVVTRGTSVYTLPYGFTYEARVDVTALQPVSGPAEGGTMLTISGHGFSSSCSFTLGGAALTATVTAEDTATAAAPPGSPGPADLVVSCPGMGSDTLAGAFKYAGALTLFSVEPLRGSISGGTFVRIRGTGFSTRSGLAVSFDMSPAAGVSIQGDNLIVAYTPPHPAGAVPVTLSVGMEMVTHDRAFTYYDPAFIVGGARGQGINGAVNITAIDIVNSIPIVGALAVLGTENGSEYTAFTDERGQAVLSGPDVMGPQTVTLAHCNYTYTTFSSINASDITVWAFPLFPPRCGPPAQGGSPPPGPVLPPPPIIRGKVTGFAKELFDPAGLGPDEVAAAFVYHSWDSLGGPPNGWSPAASQVVFVEGGSYEIPEAWRTGPMAVIAIAGIYNTTTSAFRAMQLGFYRGLIADRGGIYEDRDINLSIPLTKRLTIQFPDAPYDAAKGVTANFVYPILNLGGEGVHPIPGWEREGSNMETQYTLENFAQAPGDLFTFYALFYNPLTTYPEAAVLQDGEGPLGPAVALGPLVGFPDLVSPTDNGGMEMRTIRIKPPVGQEASFYHFTFNALDGTSWDAYVEGNRTKLILPMFPTYPTYEYAPPNLPAGAVFGNLETVFVPGFHYDSFSYLELLGYARRSWTNFSFRVVNAGN